MNTSFVVGLLISALSIGCGGGDSNGNSGSSGGVKYFNPNPQVVFVDSSKSSRKDEGLISYDSLVDMVYSSNGEVHIPVFASSVALYDHGVLNQRYVLAWTVSLQGSFRDLDVVLLTSDVEREEFGVLDQSYGYASERSMNGSIGGNTFVLSRTKKNVDDSGVLNQRYGMAYSEELSGSLGDNIEVILQSVPGTKTGGILDQNFGYSWINSGTLVLKVRKQLKYF